MARGSSSQRAGGGCETRGLVKGTEGRKGKVGGGGSEAMGATSQMSREGVRKVIGDAVSGPSNGGNGSTGSRGVVFPNRSCSRQQMQGIGGRRARSNERRGMT
jgi:hypothetical protein